MNKYKIKFGFQEDFDVEADSIKSAEDKIIQFVQCELDRLRDSEDCCSFEVMEFPLDSELKLI